MSIRSFFISFPRSNSSFFLCSGNASQSAVLRVREDIFLVDAGPGTPRICMQDEPTGVPINRATRFENKVGSLDVVAGESLIKKRILERLFINLVAGESLIKKMLIDTFWNAVLSDIKPISRVAFQICFIIYMVSSIYYMYRGGIGDAIVPFLTRNGNPDPGLPPSSSGEPFGGLLTENHRHDEMATTLQEIPSVEVDDLWEAIDQIEEPLISDAERRDILEQKLISHHRKTETRVGREYIEKQMRFEKCLEKHLKRNDYTPERIRRVFPTLRSKFLYVGGMPRKMGELQKWIDEMEGNFLSSSPYKLIQKWKILFTRGELNVQE